MVALKEFRNVNFDIFFNYPAMNPYHANIFDRKCCLLFISAAYILMHSRQILSMGENTMNTDQTASKRSSLIWVHIVCI